MDEERRLDDEVHVWKCNLDPAPDRLEAFSKALSAEETSRASRFFFGSDRDRFLARRGARRFVLSTYLRLPADAIEFECGAAGKPGVAAGGDLRFNLAHSGPVGLVGVCRGRELGIDVERIRNGFGGEEIASRFFSPPEIEEIHSRPEAGRDEFFFRCWTAKEALVKGLGEGRGFPLDRFWVSGREPAGPVEHALPVEKGRWSIVRFEPETGYVGALAVEGDVPRVKFFELGDDLNY